ncbi:MAG: hypothetical protein BGO31_20535 [Bacteroidetes bacterium 43-16]|nr:MAG: hypothetical protein BGO31_20535 [Bacteroidetes bacterium 43-16]
MKIFKIILLPILFSFIALSCKTKVPDGKLTRTDDAAMLFGFLNPDVDTITIALSLAKGVSNKKDKTITIADLEQAEVKLEHKGQSIDLKFLETRSGKYSNNDKQIVIFYTLQSKLPILPGETYTVSAKNNSLFDLKATTTVPSKDFDFDYTISGPFPFDHNYPEYKVNMTIRDPGNGISFLRVVTHVSIKDQDQSYTSYDVAKEVQQESNGIIKYDFSFNADLDNEEKETTLSCINTTESYFRYVTAIKKGAGGGGDPFSEPTSVYTNIEGGYGIFSAFCTKSKKIE